VSLSSYEFFKVDEATPFTSCVNVLKNKSVNFCNACTEVAAKSLDSGKAITGRSVCKLYFIAHIPISTANRPIAMVTPDPKASANP